MTKLIANITGRIGHISELEKAGNDQRLTLSIPEKGFNGETQWHKITAWNKVASNASKYLKKGDVVSIDFAIGYRKAEEKTYTNFTANSITYLHTQK